MASWRRVALTARPRPHWSPRSSPAQTATSSSTSSSTSHRAISWAISISRATSSAAYLPGALLGAPQTDWCRSPTPLYPPPHYSHPPRHDPPTHPTHQACCFDGVSLNPPIDVPSTALLSASPTCDHQFAPLAPSRSFLDAPHANLASNGPSSRGWGGSVRLGTGSTSPLGPSSPKAIRASPSMDPCVDVVGTAEYESTGLCAQSGLVPVETCSREYGDSQDTDLMFAMDFE